MRRGYSQDIRAEAITRRYQGREWKEIQATIRGKFGVRPSIRQMQKWFEDYRGTTDDPTGVRYVAKVVEDSANLAKPLAQAKMMSEVFPLWYHFQQHNLQPVEAGLVAVLCFFESQVGRENLDHAYSLYRELRDRLPQQPLPWPSVDRMRQTQPSEAGQPSNIKCPSINESPDDLKERRE
jgi:hypothetical protein